MGILAKLTTLARGTARESAEVLLDANAIRVFEQEIVDVEQSIGRRKKALSEVIVSRNQIEREIESLKAIITKREEQAKAVFEENASEKMLDDIIDDIAKYEDMLCNFQEQQRALSQRIMNMESALRQANAEVAQYRRDLRVAKAQQVGFSSLAKSNNLPKQLSELESTRRHIVDMQTGDDDREAAWVEMEGMMDPHGMNKRFPEITDSERRDRRAALRERLLPSTESAS